MKIHRFIKPFKFITILSIVTILLSVFFLFAMQKSSIKASSSSTKFDDSHSNNGPKAAFKPFTKAYGPTVTPSVKNPEETPVPSVKPPEKDVHSYVPPASKPGFKTACLTFDDGPSIETTPKILDILDTCKVKATFFVIGANALKYSDILKRTYDSGHIIGNHTYSHDINYFTIRPGNMVADFYKGAAAIKTILPDYKLKLARIPGGSLRWNVSYRNAVKAAGFHAVDWNCLSRDAEGINVPSKTLFENVKRTAVKESHLIILMHDSPGKDTTVESLPEIIEYLKAQGFTFKVLN